MISVALVQYCFDTVLLHTAEASREHLGGIHSRWLAQQQSLLWAWIGIWTLRSCQPKQSFMFAYICTSRIVLQWTVHCVTASSSAPVMPMWLCISVHTRGGELSSLVLCSIHYVQHLLCQ